MNSTSINTILFDLDGTLLDTAEDLGNALNKVLQKYGFTSLALPQIRQVISKGAAGLIELGINIDESHTNYPLYRQQFMQYYANNLCHKTKPFPGILTLLNFIETRQMQWGIVTSKQSCFAKPLLQQLNLYERAACLVCADTIEQQKPDPAPLLYACELISSAPQHCVYVGDSQSDILAGKRAGMLTALALYGYLNNDSDPSSWQADYELQHADELIGLL